jgi:hypothetical protein
MHGQTTLARCDMMRQPLQWRNRYTAAPSGYSMTPATTTATNLTVVPKTLHWHGLLRILHYMQIGTIVVATCCSYCCRWWSYC